MGNYLIIIIIIIIIIILFRCIHYLKANNIWLRYNYLKIWSLRVQKNLNI